MNDCAPWPPASACPAPSNPCDDYYRLWRVVVGGATDGEVTTYRVGEETYQLNRMSLSDKMRLMDLLYNACIASGGCVPNLNPPKRRARICLVPGDHRCRMCGTTICGCRR